jgi:hypothetical protein
MNEPQIPHEYRLIISDGTFYTQSWLATELNTFITNNVMVKNLVILVKSYDVHKINAKGSIIITLHDIDVLQATVSDRIAKPKRLRYVDEGGNVNVSEGVEGDVSLLQGLGTPSTRHKTVCNF